MASYYSSSSSSRVSPRRHSRTSSVMSSNSRQFSSATSMSNAGTSFMMQSDRPRYQYLDQRPTINSRLATLPDSLDRLTIRSPQSSYGYSLLSSSSSSSSSSLFSRSSGRRSAYNFSNEKVDIDELSLGPDDSISQVTSRGSGSDYSRSRAGGSLFQKQVVPYQAAQGDARAEKQPYWCEVNQCYLLETKPDWVRDGL